MGKYMEMSTWVNYLDSIDTSSIGMATSEEFRHHANALMWGLGLILFGFCVLAYDTQLNRANYHLQRTSSSSGDDEE